MWWPSNVGSMGLPDNVAKTRMCVCVCVCVCVPVYYVRHKLMEERCSCQHTD